MNRKEVFNFITANPSFALATTDGDRPRVRTMQLVRADDNGIIFSTGAEKDVCRQLRTNPAVELCFFSPEKGMQIRITGTAEPVDDLDLKKQIVKAFPFLEPWIEAAGYDVMAVFSVVNAKAAPWTMETNEQPKQYIDL